MASLFTASVVSGNQPQTIRNWIAAGLFTPAAREGMGRGGAHQFSIPQIVGLCVAKHLQRDERGCALSYVGKVVTAFGKVNEEWLRNEFAAGRKYFVMVHYNKPLLMGGEPSYGRANVEQILTKVVEFVDGKKGA